MKNIAEEWALLNGYKVDQWLGDGDFGEAYITTCNKVIKITSDTEEFVAAYRIKDSNEDDLIQIYKTDVHKNNLVILMENLETDGIEDIFNEILAHSEHGITETLLYNNCEDFDLTDEATTLFSDIQNCIHSYQKNGVNPMDIHAGNIGSNSKGKYVLFDQKDKTVDLKEELNEIIESQEKEKIIQQLSAPKVKLNYSIKELEYESSIFNDKMCNLMTATIERIKEKQTSILTKHNRNTHPELTFPENVDIEIYFTTNPEISDSFSIHNELEHDVLGFQAITTGDGILGEAEYMDKHACVIIIDETKYKKMSKNSFLSENEFLKNYLTTITHELNHIFEFIENSGGLSPKELENAHECDDIEFNQFDCMTGYNILPMFDSEELDTDDALEIMEERVELKGNILMQKIDIQKEIEDFILSSKNKKNKMKIK